MLNEGIHGGNRISPVTAYAEGEALRRLVLGHSGVSAAASACGEGRNRTGDTTVFSRVLYRLSYLARRAPV